MKSAWFHWLLVELLLAAFAGPATHASPAPDTNGPVLVSARHLEDGTFDLKFDEPVLDFIDVFGVFIYPKDGDPWLDDLVPFSGTLRPDGMGFLMTTEFRPQIGIDYVVDISGGVVLDLASNVNLDIFAFPVMTIVRPISFDSCWTFLDDGTDQGTDWRALAFDGASWSKGPGALGEDNRPSNLPGILTPFPAPGNGGPVTVYFRHVFTLPQAVDVAASARLRALFDDGIVVYLNGVEVARQGVAPNQDHTTLAARHEADEIVEFDLVPSLFTAGTNILAVELHQASPDSADAVWAGELILEVTTISGHPGPPQFTDHPMPAHRLIEEGLPMTFSVCVDGFPRPQFQWHKDGEIIPGATNPVLHFPFLTVFHLGTYTCVASNALGMVTSEPAILAADPGFPLMLVDGCALADRITIELTFTEAVSQVSGMDPSHYSVERVDGGGTVAVTNILHLGSRIILMTEPRELTDYRVTVTDLADSSGLATGILPNPTVFPLPSEFVVLDADAMHDWRYLDDGRDPGMGWFDPSFDDSSWPMGRAAFYYREPPGNLPVPVRTTLSPTNTQGGPIITYYFRTAFDFPFPPGEASLRMEYLIDDGAAFYVNGSEVHRVGLPATGPLHAHTLATRTQGTDLGWEDRVDLTLNNLVQGRNHLTVEVHQAFPSSSDRAMATRLLAKVPRLPCQPRFTGIQRDSQGLIILEFENCPEGAHIQYTRMLPGPGQPEIWETLPGGPHDSPVAFLPSGTARFFRLMVP